MAAEIADACVMPGLHNFELFRMYKKAPAVRPMQFPVFVTLLALIVWQIQSICKDDMLRSLPC